MKIAVCTSFNKEGRELYGREFVKSFREHADVPLFIFYDGFKTTPVETETVHPLNYWLNLEPDRDRQAFMSEFGHVSSKNYRYQAAKFANKVFAVTSPERPPCDWWVWIDADVRVVKDLDDHFWDEMDGPVISGGFAGSYLGRKDWNHSESGFIAYNSRYSKGFLERFREVYTSGELFDHLEWHDSYIFDRVREEFPKMHWRNLSKDASGLDVWPQTALGEYMLHNKGRKKYQET